MENPKQMFDMKLNDKLVLDNHTTIIRVPGGWIYRTCHSYYYGSGGAAGGSAHTFIPEGSHVKASVV